MLFSYKSNIYYNKLFIVNWTSFRTEVKNHRFSLIQTTVFESFWTIHFSLADPIIIKKIKIIWSQYLWKKGAYSQT